MTRPLTPEERKEAKQYSRLADAFTPLSKGMNSEYANQNTYDCIQVHGGSGFMLEYACQRLYRDARITSIYEGTTQLQVVAAIRYVTNGTYSNILREMQQEPVSEALQPLMDRVVKMTGRLDAVVAHVKEQADALSAAAPAPVTAQEYLDLMSRHLYDIAAVTVMSCLLVRDASAAPELFADSAHVYAALAESEVAKHAAFVENFRPDRLPAWRQ